MVRSHHRTGPITAAMVMLVLTGAANFAAPTTNPEWSKPDWDLRGAIQGLQLVFRVGYGLTEGKEFPNGYPDSEFRATREAMLAQPAESK